MSAISNISASSTAPAAQERGISAVNGVKAAQHEDEQKTSAALSPAVSFEHETKESAGRYWVESAESGQQIRFEKPTTVTASANVGQATNREAAADTKTQRGSADESAAEDERASRGKPLPEENAADRGPEEPDEKNDSNPERKASTTTCSTDAVDRELERLRAREQKLEQAARTEGDDEDAAAELADVQRELAMKDNDAYRRAHAHFS